MTHAPIHRQLQIALATSTLHTYGVIRIATKMLKELTPKETT